MATITIVRGADIRIPFAITDAENGLAGMRVSWCVGSAEPRVPDLKLVKQSDLGPASSADITITAASAGSIMGTVNLDSSDFDDLPEDEGPFECSLWIDDNINIEACVTPGGTDKLVIQESVRIGTP